MQSALIFLVKTLADLYLLTFLLRFIMQWVRASYYNPLAQFVFKVTSPLVVPARRVLPSVARARHADARRAVHPRVRRHVRAAATRRPLATDSRSCSSIHCCGSIALALWFYTVAPFHLRPLELVRRSRQKPDGRAARRARRAAAASGAPPVAADRRPRSVAADRDPAAASRDDRAAAAQLTFARQCSCTRVMSGVARKQQRAVAREEAWLDAFARWLASFSRRGSRPVSRRTASIVTSTQEGVLPATESTKDFGEYVLYFNALNTDQLSPDIAREYGIVRSKSRAMLNVSIHRKLDERRHGSRHGRRVGVGHQFERPAQDDDAARDPRRHGDLLRRRARASPTAKCSSTRSTPRRATTRAGSRCGSRSSSSSRSDARRSLRRAHAVADPDQIRVRDIQ